MVGFDWPTVKSDLAFLAEKSRLAKGLAMLTIRFGSKIVGDAILIEKLPSLKRHVNTPFFSANNRVRCVLVSYVLARHQPLGRFWPSGLRLIFGGIGEGCAD